MSGILERIRNLVGAGSVRPSDHAYDRFLKRDIRFSDVLAGVADANLIEEYLDDLRGPCVLLLQKSKDGKPLHVLWGIQFAGAERAIVVTAYWPDETRWEPDFLKRKE